VGSAAAADSCGCVVREAWRSASPAMQGVMQRTTLDSLVDLSEGKPRPRSDSSLVGVV
jgi:DNA-binding IscR family transcriptional regulator